MLVMALTGGLAGLAGATEVMELKYRLFEQVSPGYGFDAIAIAFLSRGRDVSYLTAFHPHTPLRCVWGLPGKTDKNYAQTRGGLGHS
jgi:hypothetical protein